MSIPVHYGINLNTIHSFIHPFVNSFIHSSEFIRKHAPFLCR